MHRVAWRGEPLSALQALQGQPCRDVLPVASLPTADTFSPWPAPTEALSATPVWATSVVRDGVLLGVLALQAGSLASAQAQRRRWRRRLGRWRDALPPLAHAPPAVQLDPARVERLAARLSGAAEATRWLGQLLSAATQADLPLVLGPYWGHAHRLGPPPGAHWALTFEAIRAPHVGSLMALGVTTRQAVHLAVVGAQAPEIAQTLGRSIETVRGHLKRAYAHLEVASRVELSKRVGDLFG